MVEMSIGGDPERRLDLLLDTGAAHTVIDPDSLERVSGQRVEPGRWARFDRLESAQVRFHKLRAESRELDHLQAALGGRLDGILGFPAFKHALLIFDYPAETVRLDFDSKLPRRGPGIVPLVGSRKRPFIDVALGEERVRMLIDTGSSSGLTFTGRDDFRWRSEPVPIGASLRIDRLAIDRGGRLEEDLRIGDLRWRSPPVELLETGSNLIGDDVLREFTVSFDQRTRRMRWERRAGDDGPIDLPDLSGLGWAIFPQEGAWEVRRVFDGPAREAGIRRGDRLVAIDGTPVLQWDTCNAPPFGDGGAVRLTLEREGQTFERTVRRRVLVP